MTHPSQLPSALLLFAETGAADRVGGLSNLDRLVQSALAAHLDHVVVVTPAATLLTALVRATALGHLVFVAPGSTAEKEALEEIARGGRRFVFAHTQLALDPRYLSRLVRRAIGNERALVAVTAGAAPDHSLCLGTNTNGNGFAAIEDGASAHCPGLAILPADCAPLLAGGAEVAAPNLALMLGDWAQAGTVAAYRDQRGHLALVTDRDSRAAAERSILKTLGKESDGIVARHLNRPISQRLTGLLVDLPITPNMLTAAMFLVGLMAGAVMMLGTHLGFLLGTLLYHLNSTLDGVDGELARLRFQTTRFGAWADTISDSVGNAAFGLALPVGIHRMYPSSSLYTGLGWFVGIGVVAMPIIIAVRARRLQSRGDFSDYGRSLVRAAEHDGQTTLTRGFWFLTQIVRRDSYALIFFGFAILGGQKLILWGLALGLIGHLVTLGLRQSPASHSH